MSVCQAKLSGASHDHQSWLRRVQLHGDAAFDTYVALDTRHLPAKLQVAEDDTWPFSEQDYLDVPRMPALSLTWGGLPGPWACKKHKSEHSGCTKSLQRVYWEAQGRLHLSEALQSLFLCIPCS